MKKKRKNNNAGMTLAEIIVTFALMGIFLGAVATIITSSVFLHSELTGAMYAQNVSEMLLNKVTGELAGAKPVGEEAMVMGTLLLDGVEDGQAITFYDKRGNYSEFLIRDGLLVMHSGQDWKMDENAYMGYRVTQFLVERLNDQNILEVKLKIQNLKTGFEYSASKAVCCYNFRTEEDFHKIREKEIRIE